MSALIKKNWRRPLAPRCQSCGREVSLVAHHTGDGWVMLWDEWCGHCLNDTGVVDDDQESLVGEQVWPFVGDWAGPVDWARLNIEVV